MPVFTSAVISIGARIYSAYSQYQQGQAQQGMAEYNAQIARNNAISAERNAEAKANNLLKEQRRQRARLQSQIAKSGATLSGTPLLVMAEQAGDMALDLENIRKQGKYTAQRYRTKAVESEMQGEMLANKGTSRAIGTVVSKATQFAGTEVGKSLLGD